MVALGGCATHPPAPVVDLSGGVQAPPNATPAAVPAASVGYAIVQPGDTLYAISLKYSLDWHDLAQWNGLAPPYTLYPGTRLRLTRPPHLVTTQPLEGTPVSPAASASPRAHTPKVGTPPAATSPALVTTATPSARIASGQCARARQVGGIAWCWPARGKIIGDFAAGDPTRMGIDVAGRRGEPVRAAAAGVVVYSGSGLPGYGNLIIIKHSEVFLSAYGHNSKRLVHEGEQVAAGQEIAQMGSSGTSRVELHFEIRKHGKPVDPQAFLPSSPGAP